jgi:hypothetical protein
MTTIGRVLASLACCAVLGGGMSGCSLFEANAAPEALRGSFETISGEYLDYVEADGTLDEFEKDTRRRHVEEHRALLEDMSHGTTD